MTVRNSKVSKKKFKVNLYIKATQLSCEKYDKDIKKLKSILQMILDSRTDIENWFLEAFYKLKN